MKHRFTRSFALILATILTICAGLIFPFSLSKESPSQSAGQQVASSLESASGSLVPASELSPDYVLCSVNQPPAGTQALVLTVNNSQYAFAEQDLPFGISAPAAGATKLYQYTDHNPCNLYSATLVQKTAAANSKTGVVVGAIVAAILSALLWVYIFRPYKSNFKQFKGYRARVSGDLSRVIDGFSPVTIDVTDDGSLKLSDSVNETINRDSIKSVSLLTLYSYLAGYGAVVRVALNDGTDILINPQGGDAITQGYRAAKISSLSYLAIGPMSMLYGLKRAFVAGLEEEDFTLPLMSRMHDAMGKRLVKSARSAEDRQLLLLLYVFVAFSLTATVVLFILHKASSGVSDSNALAAVGLVYAVLVIAFFNWWSIRRIAVTRRLAQALTANTRSKQT